MRILTKLKVVCCIACLIGLFAAPVSLAEEPSKPSTINRHFVNPDYEKWVSRFERSGREVYDRRHDIVTATDIKPGMVVADIGAGTGLFTRLLSEKVGASGKVFAVDISRVFIDNIMRNSREHNQHNVEGILNNQKGVALPPKSIDLAFICATYHHFEAPETMMASIRSALKPDGSVIIIDFRKIPGLSTPWVLGHVRANKSTIVKEIQSFGFRLVEDRDFLKKNYYLRFVATKNNR